MPIKMSMPDESPDGRRRIANAKGHTNAKTGDSQRNFALSGSAYTPIRTGQSNATGMSITQPAFFSPLHTPQNWQIASRRKEIYQWLYLPSNTVLTEDFTHKVIYEVVGVRKNKIEDTITDGFLYENFNSEPILSSSGIFRQACRFSSRNCNNKECYEIDCYGYWRSLSISEEHPVIVMDGEKYRYIQKQHAGVEYSKSQYPNRNTEKLEIKDLIIRKEAREVTKQDYLLYPVSKCGIESLKSDKAWAVGLCIADGTISSSYSSYVRFTQNKNETYLDTLYEVLDSNFEGKTSSAQHGDGNGWRIGKSNASTQSFFESYIVGKLTQKKFTKNIFNLDKESRLHVLGGYFDGDGHFNPREGKLIANNYSCDMADQLYALLISCGINCSLKKHPITGKHFKTNSTDYYSIIIPCSEVPKLQPYLRSNKIPCDFVAKKTRELRFFYTENGITYLVQPIRNIREFSYSGIGYDMQVDPERAFVASGFACSNCRFYYENEPKVAAGVDFYSLFPMNGFELECKSKAVRKYFEEQVKELKLNYWFKLISHEYHLIGDVFPHLEYDCPVCNGKGTTKDGKQCTHPGGRFKSITVLNPDNIEVEDSPFPDQRKISLRPDETLKKIVSTREPIAAYNRIPDQMKLLIASGTPITLSSRCVSHIKHSEVPYARYGTSMLRRLFTTLAYKTKLMTANWTIAERLILPVRVVKLGEKDRPAGPDDIADMQQQMSAVANDPNLTIVTHHAFEYEWFGASGKIHNIQQDLDYIGKEILDGLMLNQSLLNGEMTGYSSAQVGIETLIKRLDSWRNSLSDWVEEKIFKPLAQMQGFIDEEATEEQGKTVYLYPTIKWNDMQLRDKTNKLQMYMQLHQQGIISTERLLEEFDIDYDQETERLRMQSAMSSPGMGGPPGGGGMPGGPPGGGMSPGGMGGDIPGGGGMTGAVGAPGGGAPPMGGAPGGAPPMGTQAGASDKVYKKGKAPKAEKPEEVPFVPPSFVNLTKIEQKLWKVIQELQLPFKLYGQFKQRVAGEPQPYVMDFALPELMVDVEADGAIWHEQPGRKQKDAERDRKLASNGWRVIRFTETAINERLGEVKKVIEQNIKEAAEEKFSQRKKAETDGNLKYAANDLTSDLLKNSEYYDLDGDIVESKYYPLGMEYNGIVEAVAQVVKLAEKENNDGSDPLQPTPDEDSGPQED